VNADEVKRLEDEGFIEKVDGREARQHDEAVRSTEEEGPP
jgi:hypothetical protein